MTNSCPAWLRKYNVPNLLHCALLHCISFDALQEVYITFLERPMSRGGQRDIGGSSSKLFRTKFLSWPIKKTTALNSALSHCTTRGVSSHSSWDPQTHWRALLHQNGGIVNQISATSACTRVRSQDQRRSLNLQKDNWKTVADQTALGPLRGYPPPSPPLITKSGWAKA